MHSAEWTALAGRVCLIAYVSTSLFGSSMAYTWPNPLLEELDSELYDRKGYNSRGLPVGLTPNCNAFIFGTGSGRANVADWVRTVSIVPPCILYWGLAERHLYRHTMIWLRTTRPMALEALMPPFVLRKTELRFEPDFKLLASSILSFFRSECWRWIPEYYSVYFCVR